MRRAMVRPKPVSTRLGGKESVEYAVTILRWNASAVVAHNQSHRRTSVQIGGVVGDADCRSLHPRIRGVFKHGSKYVSHQIRINLHGHVVIRLHVTELCAWMVLANAIPRLVGKSV